MHVDADNGHFGATGLEFEQRLGHLLNRASKGTTGCVKTFTGRI